MLDKTDPLPAWAAEMFQVPLSEPWTENEKESHCITNCYELKAHFFLSS